MPLPKRLVRTLSVRMLVTPEGGVGSTVGGVDYVACDDHVPGKTITSECGRVAFV